MNRTLFLLPLLVFFVIPNARADRPLVIRVATLAPTGSTWMNALERGAAEIKTKTAGRVTFKFYPGGVKGDERAVIRLMNSGQLEAAVVTSVGLAMIEPSIRVLELPRIFESLDELDFVREGLWPHFQEKFADRGYHLGYPGDVGWLYLMSKHPIDSISSLRNAKVWQWTDDVVAQEFYTELGITGIPLGVPGVLPALTSGRINACYGSPLAALALQWNTKVRYLTDAPIGYLIGTTLVRLETWNRLSQEDKVTVSKILEDQARRLMRIVRRDNKKALKTIQNGGVMIVSAPEAFTAALDKAARRVHQTLSVTLNAEVELGMLLELKEKYRNKQ